MEHAVTDTNIKPVGQSRQVPILTGRAKILPVILLVFNVLEDPDLASRVVPVIHWHQADFLGVGTDVALSHPVGHGEGGQDDRVQLDWSVGQPILETQQN